MTVLRWAEDESPVTASGWKEDAAPATHSITKCSSCDDVMVQCRCAGPHEIRYAVCDSCSRTAQRNRPSKPYFTDEYEPTNETLWERVLEVVNGKRRQYTQSGRTINSPNHGRGYRHMPNPKGIAWAVKQYKGFGGGWKARKEDVVAHTAELRIMARGGVVVARPGELDALGTLGLARVASEAHGRVYWDVTAKGQRVALSGLKQELLQKVKDLQDRAKAYPEDSKELNLSREDKLAMKELAVWFRKHFRVDSAKTPKGQKRLKEEALSFLERLEDYSNLGGSTSPGVLRFDNMTAWGRTVQHDLDNLVRFFTAEGDVEKGRKEEVVEIKLAHAVYINRAILSEANFRKYAAKIDDVFGRLKGWRAKALKGTVTVVFQAASAMKIQGKYVTAKDEMWVKATPAVMKRGEGSYGSPDYILIHELGHRYERFHGTHFDFDRSEWFTTAYSRKESFGASESFAELFALGHFGIKGNWDPGIVDRFEAVMTGRAEV